MVVATCPPEDGWIEYNGPIPIRVRRLHNGAGYAFDYRAIHQVVNNPELRLKATNGIRIDPDLIDWGPDTRITEGYHMKRKQR